MVKTVTLFKLNFDIFTKSLESKKKKLTLTSFHILTNVQNITSNIVAFF